ncbi:MAG: DAK2 domain-containing protein, partial [Ilumatobacteraceae bacterium]|nr:DAK2 domain-containing protein [Ilumatobacteraceae bacterium]
MPVLEQLGADALRHTLVTYRNTLKRHQADLNKLNVYPVPDGDTGSNMARTLDAVVAELDKHPDSLDETYNAISHGSLMGARGNSGVILSQILRGLSATLKVASEHGAVKVAEALKAASVAAYDSVLKPIEGTILTVVREAADAAVRAAGDGATLAAMLRVARAAGRESLANTPELLPVLKEAGVVDAGGAGFLLLLDSALHVVDGEPLPEPENLSGPNTEQLIAVM